LKQKEQILWNRLKEGSNEALGELFEICFHELYFYGLKIVPVSDLVKDVIHDMFIRLWDRREHLGDVNRVKPYLLVTLKNDLVHVLKKNRFTELDTSIKWEPFVLAADDFIINEENSEKLNQRLAQSLNHLSERQREVLILRFYHNLGFDEMGEVLEMNVQSVRNLLFRALEKVRKELKDVGFHSSDNIEIILFSCFLKKK